jgi:hypothetical protein
MQVSSQMLYIIMSYKRSRSLLLKCYQEENAKINKYMLYKKKHLEQVKPRCLSLY